MCANFPQLERKDKLHKHKGASSVWNLYSHLLPGLNGEQAMSEESIWRGWSATTARRVARVGCRPSGVRRPQQLGAGVGTIPFSPPKHQREAAASI
jgi:hypothetical protein